MDPDILQQKNKVYWWIRERYVAFSIKYTHTAGILKSVYETSTPRKLSKHNIHTTANI